jgi:hypothetical protein
MAFYETKITADVWSKPTDGNHLGQLPKGFRIEIGWFWASGRGLILAGSGTSWDGRGYVNQADLIEVPAVEPPPTDPPEGPIVKVVAHYENESTQEFYPVAGATGRASVLIQEAKRWLNISKS